MTDTIDVWAFSEKPALLFELIDGAHGFNAGSVTALVLGPRTAAQEALARGADRVLWLGERREDALVDDYISTIASLLDQHSPALLLVGATRRGRAVAGRLAARCNVTVLTDVLQLNREEQSVQVRHMIFGGGAVRVDKAITDFAIVTVGPGVYSAQPAREGAAGDIIEVPFIAPDTRIRLRERKARPPVTVNLPGAKRVVCGGRGLARKEDLDMVSALARALGAELACTRPLAEGLDWLPRERYIGISGATVRPDLYLGVGVSGQVQHLIGMSGSRVVVAINKDGSAPIFQQADYGIVGDLYAILPELMKALESRK